MNPKTRVCLLLILGLSAILLGRLLFWTEPYGVVVDEATGMVSGERLSAGGIVYETVVNRKPPLLYWTHQFLGGLYGYWNIHGLHAVGVLITFVLSLLAWALSKSPAAFLLFAAYSSAFPRTFIGVNAEYFMMIPTVIACLIFLHAVRSKNTSFVWIIVATFVAAIGTLYKQYGSLIYALMYLTWAGRDLYEAPQKRQAVVRHLKLALGNLMALALCYVPLCLYFYWNGAWESFLYWTVLDALFYRQEVQLDQIETPSALFPILGMIGAWLPLWILSVMAWKKKTLVPQAPLLFAAGVGAFITIFLSGRYYTHYFVPILFFLCVWAGPYTQQLWQKLSMRKLTQGAYAFLLSLPFFFFLFFNQGWLPISASGSFNQEVQYKMQTAAHWLRGNSSPEERIAVWGMAAQFYLMAERGAASRHIFADFVSGRLPGLSSPVSQPLPQAWPEYKEDLLREASWFVDTSGAAINDYGYFPPDRFPHLNDFLNEHFEKVTEIEGIRLWKRKTDFQSQL